MLQCSCQDNACHVLEPALYIIHCAAAATVCCYVAVAVRMVVYACDVVRGEEVTSLRVTLRMFTHKRLLVHNVHMALRC